MELLDPKNKKIMEECKAKARGAGLRFDNETLEYMISNREFAELEPKIFIPTLYDYWVFDLMTHQERGKYKQYPHNPYECVVNTRPGLSFYNETNPDWLNVMIFYHVLGHIDFFQNNNYFRHTWNDDFKGKAHADKRLIADLRDKHGRFVDYFIEFSRGMDNLTGYFEELNALNFQKDKALTKTDYYFNKFLQEMKGVKQTELMQELCRYNDLVKRFPDTGEIFYFSTVSKRFPEFEAMFEKEKLNGAKKPKDLIEFVMEHSEKLNRMENNWIKQIIMVIRETSLYFDPQIRTKIMNEGWATYWHEKLFLDDPNMKGNEIDFALINAGVTATPRLGFNPYGLGRNLFKHIEVCENKGRYSEEYRKLKDIAERKKFDRNTVRGLELLFEIRRTLCDAEFINRFIDQDFVDEKQLFVAGFRMNLEKEVWEVYVKSKKAQDYKEMVLDSLYHPPHITFEKKGNSLYLNHKFEGRPLVKQYIENTMMGIEQLWGAPVMLETSEIDDESMKEMMMMYRYGILDPKDISELKKLNFDYKRVIYTMYNKKLTKVAKK